MASPTQVVPGYYVWETPGSRVTVHLSLDVVDRLSAEVMRGFGAVRKRGAEMGGLLLGRIEVGAPTVVRIDGYESVPCEYRLGPSYQFTEEDSAVFEAAFERHRPIGYFRSHTREALALAPEDVESLEHFFRDPAHVALLIKPYASTASTAGIFVCEGGRFPEVSPLEFPFRRNELTGEAPPARRPLMERRPRVDREEDDEPREQSWRAEATPVPAREAAAAFVQPPSFIPLSWGPAVWITLMCFLLLGGFLGFEVARSTPAAARPSFYALTLRVAKTGDNLSVTWNGQSPMVLAARSGLLEIEDGISSKPVELDAAQLRNGRIIYRNGSSTVRFRLTVRPEARVSVTEALEWRQ